MPAVLDVGGARVEAGEQDPDPVYINPGLFRITDLSGCTLWVDVGSLEAALVN